MIQDKIIGECESYERLLGARFSIMRIATGSIGHTSRRFVFMHLSIFPALYDSVESGRCGNYVGWFEGGNRSETLYIPIGANRCVTGTNRVDIFNKL